MELHTQNESTMILWTGNQLHLESGKRFNLLYSKCKKDGIVPVLAEIYDIISPTSCENSIFPA